MQVTIIYSINHGKNYSNLLETLLQAVTVTFFFYIVGLGLGLGLGFGLGWDGSRIMLGVMNSIRVKVKVS